MNFDNLGKMKIRTSEPRDYSGRSGKGLIASLGIDTIRRPKKIKKERFAITKVSLKDISKIIMEFKDLPYEGYVGKRYKHMSTDSHFYLERKLCKIYDEQLDWTCKNTKNEYAKDE